MGFFDSIFSSQDAVPSKWKQIKKVSNLDEIVQDSHKKPVVIYKHSTSCGLSLMKMNKMVEDWDFKPEDLDFYYLDLLQLRPISNEIESRFQVRHESPQILIFKDGEVVFNTSHHNVTVQTIREAIKKIAV